MAEQQTEKQDFKHLVRVANVDLPGDKSIGLALTNIKGVGTNFAHALCAVAGIDKTVKTGYLQDQQIALLNKVATTCEGIPLWMYNHRKDFETGQDKHVITGTLIYVQDNDLKRMKRMKSYKGLRHQRGLPVRGQRTKSNFRKNKGKVVGVSKKKAAPGSDSKAESKGKSEGKK